MKKFQRCQEDFTCLNCGAFNKGDGYTNHCRKCLYSRHVDNNPGDRSADCGALMAPVELGRRKGAWVITHQCKKCVTRKINRINSEEELQIFLEHIQPQLARKHMFNN